MNASYKIVLLGAFLLFAAVVGFYVLSGDDQAEEDPQAEAGEAPLYALDDTPGEPQPAAEPAFEPGPEPRPGLDTLRNTEEPAVAEETIGETPDELPEAPVIGSLPGEGALASAEAPDDTVRPAPESAEGSGSEDPASPAEEVAEPTEDPRPAPTTETEDPIEEADEPEAEPSPRPVPPAPATIPRTYTVKAGDTFASIAVEFYGEERAWFDIAQANPSIDPKRLQVGDRIVLPNRETVVREREEVQPPAPGNDQNYTVRPGDNLSKIAKRFYGNSEKWDLIYARNRKLIGPRPDALKVGMDLVIPQAYDGAE